MKKLTSSCGFRLLTLSALLACAALLPVRAARADAGPLPEAAPAASTGQGTVLKDKVNIRARASRSAEVVAQAHKGDSLAVLERKTVQEGARSMDWLRVTLPPTAKCYVSTKLLQDGAAASDEVNVRCGPGSNYREVGKLAKGEKVDVTKTHGEWSEIAPTEHCSGWIAAEFVDVAAPAMPPAAATSTGATDVATPPAALPVVPVAAPGSTEIQPTDNSDNVHVEYVVKEGILKPVKDDPTAPASYELRTPDVEGRSYRMAYLSTTETNLSRYEDKPVRIYGNQRWQKADRYPVIAIERIDIIW
jgi:uncharacterized protein YgiM (DUF1202 family)